MSVVNQYSFVLFLLVVFGIFAVFLFRKGIQKQKLILFGLVFAGALVIWFLIKPTQNVSYPRVVAIGTIGSGTPVLLEFQSPF